ncbi:hypothetical protein GO613_12610 [Azoarcus communis]|uniref:hypothetical protein n=1 Tax=Parazoarcus communis TaxID=41977 RepID=UPI0014592DB1|nr:hypothetical protein [Parazoarcus communis]NMG48942.1 hypothetical protein [Parazoarcus communis]
MAALSGFKPLVWHAWVQNNPNTVPLDVLGDALYEERGASDTPVALTGERQVVLVTADRQTVLGVIARGFADDWYDRVHVLPGSIDLGNVASLQTRQVHVWNAWRSARPLSALSLVGTGGVEVSGQPTPPIEFAPLQIREYLVSVQATGEPTLETRALWLFDTETAVLHLRANRIVVWPFAPDWTEGVRERLTWATEILVSESGAEQRRALRLAPRRAFEGRVLVEGRERTYFDNALAGWGDLVWALPIWHDVQWLPVPIAAGSTQVLCAPVGRDFQAGGLAVLRGESAFDIEAIEVESLAADRIVLKRPTQRAFDAGVRLYPVRTARLAQQPQPQRITDQLYAVELAFDVVEPCDWAAVLPAETYRGYPVFASRPDESEDLTHAWERMLRVLDNGTGVPSVTDTASTGFTVQGHRWVLHGVAERSAWRSLVYALRGRQRPVWVPSHADDLRMTAIAVDTVMDVEACGYARFALGKVGRRDVRIELSNGTVVHRRIVGAVELDAATERLALDAALTSAITPEQVARISFMSLCRMGSDAVELLHYNDAEGGAATQTTWRSLRDETEVAA